MQASPNIPPVTQQDTFQDIPLFNQYDGSFPVLNPTYKNTKYLTHFQKLKTLIKLKQFDRRSKELANIVVRELPSNYNAWEVKRICVENGSSTVEEELLFTEIILTQNIKNFQGWEFRRFIIETRGTPDGQVEFLERILLQDHKNYHLWTYRVWLVEHFGLYQQEKQKIVGWIDKDVYNNTAWTYRHLLMKKGTPLTTQAFKQQLKYVFDKIRLAKDNEAAWNYLRGWFPSIKLKNFPCINGQTYKYGDFPEVLEFCLQIYKQDQKLIQPLITLVHIYSQQNPQQAKGICELIRAGVPQKDNYWGWVSINL